jgi:hypothetical protein
VIPFYLPTPQGCNIQTFYGFAGAASSTESRNWRAWNKPVGVSHIYMMLIGGGGDGDARVSIRGFNSQNVQVLIDGIPMNDMFNGRVFWSNWFGLDNLTSGVQVQRGLGASKLSIPAIGGTMNILTA